MEVANTVASISFTLKLNFKNLKSKNWLISTIISIFMFASLFIQEKHEQQKLMSVPKYGWQSEPSMKLLVQLSLEWVSVKTYCYNIIFKK
jgi:hypothetical protein